MSASFTQTKKRIAALMRLERKIEMTALEEPKAGFVINQFGSYDDERATEKLLRGFQEVIVEYPDEEYFSFLYAGALARACRFAGSIEIYARLAASGGQYADPSGMLLPVVHWHAGDREAAQAALNAYNGPFIAKGIAPRHERVEQMFANWEGS